MASGYDKKRQDKSEIELRGRIGHDVYRPPLYKKDVELKYLPRGDIRDLEKGIDLFVDDVPTGERLRGAYTEKGKDLCVLNDITIRTHTKDGKKLEMYTSEADDFVYAIENYEKNGICRAYRADMQGIKEHYLKRHFSCREIQNVDGNYFVPINIDELDKYGLIKARCIPIGDNNVKPKKDETLADWF